MMGDKERKREEGDCSNRDNVEGGEEEKEDGEGSQRSKNLKLKN